MKVVGYHLDGDQIAAMDRAMWHELAHPRGYSWYNHIAARAVVYEGFPAEYGARGSLAAHVASRLLKNAQEAGAVRHIGGGKWAMVQQ